MKKLSVGLLSVLLLPIIAACNGNNNNNNNNEPPPSAPDISLEETGIYSGTIETDDGNVALMQLTLARNGVTAITLQTDDSERATKVLWGESDGESGSLTFQGSDTATDASVTVDIFVEGVTASGRLDIPGINGEYVLQLDSFSSRDSGLALVAGDYDRNDNLGGLSELSIDSTGAVQLSGACEASGSIIEIDTNINIYRLELDSDCIALNALVSLQDIEVESDVVAIDGDGGDDGFSLAFYRI
jgi:hypothetical protein